MPIIDHRMKVHFFASEGVSTEPKPKHGKKKKSFKMPQPEQNKWF